jgi:hypothetical protein
LCFLARRDREVSDRLRGRGFVPTLCMVGNDVVSVCAPGRERCLRSNRVVAADWLLVNYRRKRPNRQTADGPGWSGGPWCGRARHRGDVDWLRSLHRSLVDSKVDEPSDCARSGLGDRESGEPAVPAAVSTQMVSTQL